MLYFFPKKNYKTNIIVRLFNEHVEILRDLKI